MYNRPLTQVSGRISVFIRALGVGRCKSVTVRVSDFFALLESAQAWETRVRGAKKNFFPKEAGPPHHHRESAPQMHPRPHRMRTDRASGVFGQILSPVSRMVK